MTKYSIKNICLGIGIGLVFAAVINIGAAPTSLSEDQIRKEAAKYGLIVMDAKDLIKKQPDENNPAQGQVNQPEQLPTEKQTPLSEGQTVVIEVRSGATSESIAELLLNNKLIKDKQEFIKRLTELKKENKVQIGTFKIPVGSSLDKIIEIITSLPK